MVYTTLDKIIRGYLLQRGYPIHFYVDFLVYGVRCFEELHFDTLGNIRAKRIPINSYKAIPLPCDFMDETKVSAESGQFVFRLTERDGFNRLNNFDDNGNKALFGETTDLQFVLDWPDTVHFNDRGENTGRKYGSQTWGSNTYKVIKERKEIQLDEHIEASNIILEYISDGSEIDNATQITPYAKATFEAFINWKLKENSRSYNEGERDRAQRQFEHQHKILRARMNPNAVRTILTSLKRRTHGSIK